ncbi:hypothetical protein IGI04_006923 [Brassica rapa subsp. trilocularis]|uniref:Uncharacterized protein n=1 Tax=Brassica rapa subsp. trilocularis TaxID=1813537 RepID=A0ABQ7NIC0_BRACM|nr:hypothetical protein IGI04_006923 [Brassica rapa subsp. trilocularis]
MKLSERAIASWSDLVGLWYRSPRNLEWTHKVLCKASIAIPFGISIFDTTALNFSMYSRRLWSFF